MHTGQIQKIDIPYIGNVFATIDLSHRIWFRAVDVVKQLEYVNESKTWSDRIPNYPYYQTKFQELLEKNPNIQTKYKGTSVFENNTDMLSEQGLICLVFQSELDIAIEKVVPFVSHLVRQKCLTMEFNVNPVTYIDGNQEIAPKEIINIISEYIKQFQRCEVFERSINKSIESVHYLTNSIPYTTLLELCEFQMMIEKMKDIMMIFGLFLFEHQDNVCFEMDFSPFCQPEILVEHNTYGFETFSNELDGKHCNVEWKLQYNVGYHYPRDFNFFKNLVAIKKQILAEYQEYILDFTVPENHWKPITLSVTYSWKLKVD